MSAWLIWLVPPLVGAVIGYVTNAVAIKMLFRPLNEIRVFGLRLPFTPGILPRQRHKLAENIGNIVERQLLTPEIVVARLRQDDVRDKLKNAIAGYTGQFLAGAPAAGRPPILGRSVRDLLGAEAAEGIEENIARLLGGWLGKQAPRISAFVREAAAREFPRAAESFIAFLKKPDIHRLLEIHGRVFLNSAILKLNAFQRLFLSAGQFEKTLHDRMPEIIDDLIRQLEEILKDPEVRGQILDFLAGTVENKLGEAGAPGQGLRAFSGMIASFLDVPLGELLQTLLSVGDTQRKDRLDSFVRDKFLALAEGQSAALLRTIDIKTLVSDRIDTLDMLEVEHIVLDVMANQLKWINVFGAILGTLIGLFQSAFSWFIR